jgi:hypothetical protein
MAKKKVYISGPMTGRPDFNYPAFYKAEEHAKSVGCVPLNPARNFGGRTDLPREVYLRKDVEMLLQANEVWVLPGWQEGEGSKLEVAIAQALKIPVVECETQTPISPNLVIAVGPPSNPWMGWSSTGGQANAPTAANTTIDLTLLTPQGEGVCAEADRLVSTAKRGDYGHPKENFEHTAKLWSAYKGVDFTPHDVAVLMMLLKISRLRHKVTRDSVVDIAGYAKTISILEGWES